ncbi:restriction endonuclease subunit S [Psychrobacter sp. Pi2-51]|uniref:restriction endonuclease subunit S n=1 Tax=Psychrobacter sp. Pi2-51 TaxID=2774132 RepID=UPI00191B2868|nr:restriction endonuclease subunit S [Psychrobacter sp. Pi2-51]
MVPNGWEVKTLKDITLKIQDGNYGAKYPKSDELVDQGIPFLTSKALGGSGKTNPEKYDFITIEKHIELKKAHITTNDILFTNRGANVGVIGVAGEDLSDANIGPQLTLIRSNEKLVSYNYLYFSMQSSFFQKQVQGQDSGSAMNFFGIKSTEQFKIKIPPLLEQQKIAKILSTWDKAISTTERLIDNSSQQKKALMQQLLTGKKRLLDDDGKRFESEWKTAPLKDCVTFLNGMRKPIKQEDRADIQGQYPYFGATGIIDYVNDYIFDDELILLGEDGENILSRVVPHVFMVSGKIWVNNHAHVMKANKDKNSEFLCIYLESLDYRKFNSGSAQPKINKAVCEKIPVHFPSLNEQNKIATVLTNADKEIELLEQQLADLQQEKKALMQVLLTGKKRVVVDGEGYNLKPF